MTEAKFIGTAPFCDPNPLQCERTPGFAAAGKTKCGDGSCCLTGTKYKCEFQADKWKKSQLYSEMVKDDPSMSDVVPEFVWLGKAPACSASPCDLYEAGLMPIKSDNCGDGACCLTGEKWLGTKPVTGRQREMVSRGHADCLELRKIDGRNVTEGLKFGTSVLKAVATGGLA
jgi:hypothetical protein